MTTDPKIAKAAQDVIDSANGDTSRDAMAAFYANLDAYDQAVEDADGE